MHTILDLPTVHRIAVLATIPLIRSIHPEDLHRRTPCAGWDLADLLAHMTVQHRGFAAAAWGDGADPTNWDVAAVRDDVTRAPGPTYTDAALDVLDAFGVDDALQRQFAIPEFGPGAEFPGTVAIGFHLVDYVVHGWDVAASIGAEYHLPAEVIDATLPLALAIPDGEFRDGPIVPFGRARTGSETHDLDQILRHLGRDPEWTPAIGSAQPTPAIGSAQPNSTVTGA